MVLPLTTELRILGPLSGRSQVPGRRSQGYPGARELEARQLPTSGGVTLPSRERHSDSSWAQLPSSRAPLWGAPAPVFCLLVACVWLPRGEPAGEFPPLQSLAAAPTPRGNAELQPEPAQDPSHSHQEAVLAIGDATTVMGDQEEAEVLDSLALSSWERRLHRAKCAPSYLFSCFNGGECVHPAFCDCRRFNATGPRCQMVYNAGPERDSICRAWGQHHVETFDGLYYYLSGRGSYTLVGRHEPEGQIFSVQVHNDPQCGSFPYTCSKSVSLFFAGEQEIHLAKEVTRGGVRLQLPHVMGNLRLQQLAGYVLVRLQSAFTLAWDGTSAVYVKMSPEFLGWTHGLCGNNNADPQDDLVTSYGKLTDDVAEFVHSWQEQAPNQPPGPTTSSLPRPPCLQQTPGTMQGVYDRCEALLRPPFDTCHAYVSPLPFMASCTSDLCQSAGDEATWCRALAEYARACAQAGRPLQGWRNQLRSCTVLCKEKAFVYNECVACCPASCQPRASCVDSEIACVDGCYCPDGLIFEDGGCVAPAECPCEFHGTLYPTGSVVKEDCNSCTCTAGKWVCSTSVCPAECSVTGDIHFTTFDGRRYTFPATCQYILAKSRSSGTFTVTLQNAPCGLNQDGVCVQSVSVILHQDPRRQVTLTQAGDVLLFDQYKVTPPYTDDAFEIRRLSSVFLRVRTNVGVRVLYDREGLRLYLQVDQRWVEDTVGLCGTFNGNTQDDFLSPVGVPESTPQLFGNSWKTLSACSPLVSGSPLDPCDVHLQAASFALQACSVLTGELFAPCSAYLSPVPYFEQCRRDACRCGQPCLCATLAHYAHLCQRHGLRVDFRAHLPGCALSCEATKEYSPCVAPCGQTCQDLARPEACGVDGGSDLSGDECVEGCACPPDTYLDTQADLCVPRNQCSCHFQGMDYPPGDSNVPTLGHCHCKDGVMSCDSGAPAAACPAGQVFVNCSDLHADPELSRERTCEQQLLNLSVPARGPCLSGCACPQGLLRHGDACFLPEECPCTWKGKEYYPGDQVMSPCHSCVCQRGSFQCTLHPCASTCTAYGDRHYRTFDGLPFDFVGACKVHLVKSTSDFSFSVIVENVNCYSSGIICRKFISINVGNSLIIFDDDSGNPSPESFLDEKQEVHTWRAGFFTLVHFPREHITLLWDQRTTVHVQAGPQWQGQLAGLCGNFDLKTVNEMRTPENLELTNPQEFGGSWAAVECPDTLDPRDTCVLNPLREPFAKKECSVLLSEVFETCHPVVDVSWFYSNCLTDTCGCSRGGDCECFCASVSAYAHQCCQHGVAVDWRTPRLCPYDCDFFNKALGKGPYQLASLAAGGALVAVKVAGGALVLVRAEDVAPGDIVNFLLTAALYKAKAHDPDVVSLEAADRPNFFLHVTANGSLELAKWQAGDAFRHHASFSLHRGTWKVGLVALESLAEPGAFLYVSGPVLALRPYEHTEAFRRGTLFRLLDAKPSGAAYPTCEWHYDACASPCFQTCRDPWAAGCRDVPRVEGCVPTCATPKVLDEVTQRCVHLEDCVEPVELAPTEALGNETLPSGQVLPTASDREPQFPQEAPRASSYRPALTPTAPLTTALNPPTAATAGPALSSGLGVTASNLPEHPTEAPASKGVTAGHPASPGAPEPSSLPVSQHVPTSGMGSGAMETTRVTMILAESPNITVSSLSPPAPRFPLMTKAVTVLGLGSLPVKTTPLQPFPSLELPASPSSRPVASPAVTSRPPTSSGAREASLTPAITKVMTGTGVPQSIQAQGPSSPSSPPAEARTATEQIPARSLVTESVEIVPSPEKVQPGPGQPTGLPAVPLPSPFPTAPARPTQHTTTAARPPARPSGTAAAASLSTVAHALGATPFTTLESTRPAQLLSGLPPDTSLPLAKVGTSAPVATPGPKGSTLTPPLQQQVTSLALATTLPAGTLGPAPPLTPAIMAQGHPPGHAVPQTTGTAPGLLLGATLPTPGVVAVAEGAASTVSAAPQKSTTEKTAILSKQVSLPTWISGSSQGGPTELMPAVAHTAATLVTGAEGPWAGTVPLVPTSYLLSRVSARTASRESPLVLPPELAEAHGTSARPQPPAEPEGEATTQQSGRSAPAVQSISAGSAEALATTAEATTSAACVPIAEQDCVRHICLQGELIRVNRSQHCPQGASPPRCGVLGLAVRVGGDRCCPIWECACRCSVFPDLSFVTFDGSHAALFKEAIYILSQRPEEMVTVHVLDCKSANLGHLNWPPFCLVMLNVTHRTHEVTIDRFNRKVSVDSQPVWPPVSWHGFRIEDTGHMYVIRTPSHIQVQWLHSSGLMILEASRASEAQGHGLCGICDGDVANDLTLKDGSVVGEAEDPAPFLDSWQVPSSLTSVGQTRFRPDSCATADCSPCLRMVSNRTFSACHRFVPPESFCDLWIRDTKYVQQPCVALTVYVAMCHKFHVCVEWRRSDYCPFLCSSDSTYQACVSACEPAKTCQDGMLGPLDPEQCQVLGEGCVCSEGTILHRRHSGLCIPEEKCACTDSMGVPRALGETWNSSLSGCCQHQCQAPDTIIPVDLGCPGPRPESCPRFGEVALLQPTEDPCCLGTICVCNQTLCEGLAPTCSPGHRLLTHFQEDSCCPSYSCECDPDLCEAVQVPSCRQDQILIAGRLGDSCCISYLCACGDCPDPIPECQEGEALTVDRNTTELCCPLYQCVCESFRCPQVQCGMGTALVEVWSPERCCPYKSCECDCDTIPVPRCHLWEKSQLDEAFMRSAENVCGCAKYECVKAPVCLSRELGVMQPGQTVVELSADGVCHTSRCTDVLDPLTSFYQINTTSVLCDVHCEANQEYEHPRDLAACCGSCRNVSCLFTFPNGTTSLFLPGASWIADCTRHHCSSTPLGAVLVRSPISCPPLNETECAKVGGSVVPSLEGCCRTCFPGTLLPVVPISPASPPRVIAHCHPGKEDGRSCKKVTIRMTIRKNECRSNTPVNLVSCDGRCPSASIYNYNINTYARFCKCCREVGLQRRSVQLFCATNATWVPYTLQEPTDCACQWS